MTLLSDIGSLIESGMERLSSLMTDITYSRYEESSYDASVGSVTESVQEYQTEGLLTGFSREERRSQEIEFTDRKLIVLQANLPFTPTPMKDVVAIGSSEYVVVAAYADATDTTWSMQLRRRT